MNTFKKLVPVIFAVLFVIMSVLSVADSAEKEYDTNISKDNILAHIEKLTENGPRSIAHPEANAAALKYITDTLDSFGLVCEDTTDAPAYLTQDFVAEDVDYQNWYLRNVIVHIPANSDTPSGDAVMFMGHTDSVPMGDGASDDGVAVAVMLEAVGYYTEQMKNGFVTDHDLVFCFVNGEEYGLYGSYAFMEEFKGFNDVVSRIRFGTNLESRGTSGTLIMFETAANNYNTVKLFSEINENVFTCSIATMVYDMMPNGTDFSNFKEAYQGMNFANITGGENYHTQNDNYGNVGMVYLSQQAQTVDKIVTKLADYELDSLYDADESAIFFSYLNVTTVVYNHTVTYILGALLIVALAANVILGLKSKRTMKTALGIAAVVIGLVLAALLTYACYFLFQWIASLAGVIDVHMIGTITYSNSYLVIGIGILALAVTVIVSRLAVKLFKIGYNDVVRAIAYVHAFLGAVLSFALSDASYLFAFSGLGFMLVQLAISVFKKHDVSSYRFELLVTALYMPIIMPVLVLATSALGMTMAYVYGLLFALAVFALGTYIASVTDGVTVFGKVKLSCVSFAAVLLIVSMVLFLAVSLTKPNSSVNLQGKQNLAKLPYDDALVYVVDGESEDEYRIYDLNAYSALKKYAPEMEYSADADLSGYYYFGHGEKIDVEYSIKSSAEGSVLTVEKNVSDAMIYLTFSEISAESFTIDDGTTSNTYKFEDAESYGITVHSDCTVTVNGTAKVDYREVIRDYSRLIPEAYDISERLHFNLWLTESYDLK